MRVCLIGVAHPCHNPRLTREADSLVAAGHDVRVVAPSIMPSLAERDSQMLATRQWRLQQADFSPVGLGGKWRAFVVRGKRRLASEVFSLIGGESLAEAGYTTALSQLKRLASSESADWFVAHTQAALPIAVAAAKVYGARIGFDCEDLLAEMSPESSEVIRLLERKYLPFCDYVSVPSVHIGQHLKDEYSLSEPLVLYNVFSTTLAARMKAPKDRLPNEKLRVHWFGQTIGPGRGIEDAIQAVGSLNGQVELHLRGHITDDYRVQILDLAKQHSTPLLLHPLIEHDRLIESMEEFDVGLALEGNQNSGYAFTVSNKLFSYLLAGLVVVATDTKGQQEIMSSLGDVGVVYPDGSKRDLVAVLQKILKDRTWLAAAKQKSWDIARSRFCWDLEQRKFLQQIESLPVSTRSTAAA